ncbi:AfsR/SARP family transcriptional regulator [Sphaerisporangium sp. NPDC005288]|uniref:AfsR/SARP family transcriptional regulator n=2 Tax=unclassified Sphaerisporangium TaxID=2630420 RepID=UPI00339FEBE8
MRFNLLGPLEVVSGGRMCTPTSSKQRQVLALLLMRANQVVSLDAIIEELWGDHPPHSAVTTAQTYIYQLRKSFSRELGEATSNRMLATSPPGYIFRIEFEATDYLTFETLVGQARALRNDGRTAGAALKTADALALWRGAPLSNVNYGRLLHGYAIHLEERRIAALQLRIEAEMELGHHHELIAELRALVTAHPFNEWFHAQLVVALNRCGRRSEALHAYQNARGLLSEELGLDPSPELQHAHEDVLRTGARALV